MKQHVTFIKLGGAVITKKDEPRTLRRDVLDRLAGEIALSWKETGKAFVIGNGAGSFAHVPASKYKTMEGFIHEDSRLGMALTQDEAASLNRLVVEALLSRGVPAVTLAPSSVIVSKKKKPYSACLDVLLEYIRQGMVPVVYGDVIVDRVQGCTIWSTDRVFAFLARELEARGIDVDEVIHVTEAQGVWKSSKEGFSASHALGREIYPRITPTMKDEVKEAMVDTKGFDVTGGMWHKIEESLSLTELGIKTRILSGLISHALYEYLVGKKNIGTVIEAYRKTNVRRSARASLYSEANT